MLKQITVWTCFLVAVIFIGIIATIAALRGDHALLATLGHAIEVAGPFCLTTVVVLALFGILRG
ncbi:MAG: hypothetical protein HY369_04305 [Candidatus Aenigmarchaeota archaeon]|nr:hypothetical protein [Candidatus Aenigmarchaeota archaeon]